MGEKRSKTETPEPNPEARGALPLIIAFASAAVAVTTFVLSQLDVWRGSEVQLFPLETISFYRNPETSAGGRPLDRLGVSVRPEFTNTAGADFPDAITGEHVEISLDGRHLACFGSRGVAHLLTVDAPLTPAHRAERAHSSVCEDNTCYMMDDGAMLVVQDSARRRTIRPGEITSEELYFDARGVGPTDVCYTNPLQRPIVSQFVAPSSRDRVVLITYYVETLKDGPFSTWCRLSLNDDELSKLDRYGHATYACVEHGVSRSRLVRPGN